MIAANWPMQTVGAFLGAVPWQGSSILSRSAPARAVKPVDWRSQSVGAFFSNIHWDDQYVSQQVEAEAEAFQALSYMLPVQAFFGCFAWDERPNIGVIPQINVKPTKVPELSLDDLSDLF
jgi:hypothetical protein